MEMSDHIVRHQLTGRTEENAEVGLYRVVCSCGWELDDVRGYRAVADATDQHLAEAKSV